MPRSARVDSAKAILQIPGGAQAVLDPEFIYTMQKKRSGWTTRRNMKCEQQRWTGNSKKYQGRLCGESKTGELDDKLPFEARGAVLVVTRIM
jgi:hypothetical protein